MSMIKIYAKANGWLTQATLEDETSRIFVNAVMTPNADLWRDATAEEKAQWEAEHPTEESTEL